MVVGSDSPVSALWSAWMDMPGSRMASAGTTSPSFTSMRSPGTSSRAFIVSHSPSRQQCAMGFSADFSAAMASPALRSSM